MDGTSGLVPVRVANPTPYPITVYEATHVGGFSPLQEGCQSTNLSVNACLSTDLSCPPTNSGTEGEKTQQDVIDLFQIGRLPHDQKTPLSSVLLEYQDVFSWYPGDIGRTSKVYHRIPTGDAGPSRQAPRRLPFHKQTEVRDHLEEMLTRGIIQPSCSPWAAPIVLVQKKDGSTRFCVDYWRLNSVTKKDAFPLPRVDDSLDALGESELFSTLDLASGYWQVELDPANREKTAFTTHQGLYEFNVMPFGLCNAPGTFQRLMNSTLSGLQWSSCLVYLDDVIIFSKTLEEHLARLTAVLERFRSAGLKIRPSKCHLLQHTVSYLGHTISRHGIATDPKKILCLKQWPTPSNIEQLRSFLGLATYYRRFIGNFVEISAPLRRLQEKNAQFIWNENCDRAFHTLNQILTSAPVLAYPRFDKEYILDTDASDSAIGAVLSQTHSDGEHVIAYGSRSLIKAERRYSVTRKELLAMVHFVKSFRHYLYGCHFTLRTDHSALQWLRTFKEPGGQIARWLQVLEEYDFTVEHRPGSRHQNADSLSRFPHSEENSKVVLSVMALNTPGQNADTSTTAVSYGTSREDAGNL